MLTDYFPDNSHFEIGDCFQSLTFKEKVSSLKFKEKPSEEIPSFKFLLLWIVRLIHADPILMLHVSILHMCTECCFSIQNIFVWQECMVLTEHTTNLLEYFVKTLTFKIFSRKRKIVSLYILILKIWPLRWNKV